MTQSQPDSARFAHFEAIVEHSFDAIIAKDLGGTVRSWNPAAQRLFGWAPEEILGRSITAIIPPDRLEEENQIIRRIRGGEVVPKFETLRLHKDGRAVPVAITISPLVDAAGAIIGASKIAHDVTAIVKIRTRLEESERQFRTLANSIPQLAWIADGKGWIFWYNDQWFDYTGTTLEQMQGWGWTTVHHADHIEKVKERIQRSWSTGEEWEDTFPLRSREGKYRWFLSRAKPLRGDDGEIWRWFGTNTDVTEQREREEQIELLMRELAHRAKNMISIIQAIVSRTADKESSPKLVARLAALGRNQDLLTQRNWTGVPLGTLIASQLAAVADLIGNRVTIEGALDVVLLPSAAETIALAIHELTTNAMKYGALSVAEGRLLIACSITDDARGRRLCLRWQEFGGPPVVPPRKAGFGTIMIERNPRLALSAEVECQYETSGVIWKLDAPLEQVAATSSTTGQ
jgi:PAS domain S-box-containing protein